MVFEEQDDEEDEHDLDGELVDCEICGELVEFGAAQCYHCKVNMNEQYWRDWYADYLDGLNDDALAFYTPPSTMFLTAHNNLCCDRHWTDCDCTTKVTWEMAQALPKDLYDEAYEFTSSCSGCAHFYEPRCPMFRKWVHQLITTRQFPGSIDSCTEFEDWRGFDETKEPGRGLTLKEDA